MSVKFSGLVQIYTGDGKGKTTAALGLAMRAVGRGLRVVVIQFIKGDPYGEHIFAEKCKLFDIIEVSRGDSFKKDDKILKEECAHTLTLANEYLVGGKYDLIVLDEIFSALTKGFISKAQVLELLAKRPPEVELVLTGRGAPPEIIEKADLVTEMKLIKHPYDKGIKARLGIEY